MTVFDFVSREDIAKAMEISLEATYKAEKAKPHRYKLIALGIFANKVKFQELTMSIDLVKRVRKNQLIEEIEGED